MLVIVVVMAIPVVVAAASIFMNVMRVLMSGSHDRVRPLQALSQIRF